MKRNLFTFPPILIVSIVVSAGICLANLPINQSTSAENRTKARKVRLGLIGYLLLPQDYRAYQTNDLRDAWSGYIRSTNNTFRIRYTAGMVESPFQEGKAKFVWLKSERIYRGSLKYGLLKSENGGEMAATVGFVNFYATIDREADMEFFLKIVRSFRVEDCQDCERALPEPQSNALAAAPAQNRKDACHVYVVDVAMARKAFEGLRQTGNSEADAKVLSVGQTVFPEFHPLIGEEELTTKTYTFPGSRLLITASVYYTDESMASADVLASNAIVKKKSNSAENNQRLQGAGARFSRR